MWGKGVRPYTHYDLAKQLSSETVKKWQKQLSIGVLGCGTTSH